MTAEAALKDDSRVAAAGAAAVSAAAAEPCLAENLLTANSELLPSDIQQTQIKEIPFFLTHKPALISQFHFISWWSAVTWTSWCFSPQPDTS